MDIGHILVYILSGKSTVNSLCWWRKKVHSRHRKGLGLIKKLLHLLYLHKKIGQKKDERSSFFGLISISVLEKYVAITMKQIKKNSDQIQFQE